MDELTYKEVAVEEVHHIASLCRRSFKHFVQEFWEEVPGAGKLVWNWHLDVICDELQVVAERVFIGEPRSYDLVINVSPGTSKSSLVSILFPAWTWTRMPSARHLSSSHTETLVLDLASKARSVINSEKYQQCYPEVKIRHDQDTKGYYANTSGGDRITCTVGGKSPMGMHAHFLSCDDPIDPKKAVSEAEIRNARDFLTTILPSRKVDKRVSVTILVMQRLKADDPTAVMLEVSRRDGGSPVRHICLPAELADNVKPEELRERYIDGVMDPLRLGKGVLKEARAVLGSYGFAGQYQQNPVPLGGGAFKETYFQQKVKAAPYASQRVRFWDRAATEGGGCFTAGVLLAKDINGSFFVEDVVHGQWEPDERDERILMAARKDKARYGPRYDPVIYIEQEPGSSGVDAYKYTARRLAGFKVFPYRPTGSKEIRAEPWASQCAAKNVYLVDSGTWDLDDFVKEHCQFPLGSYCDMVDAASGAFSRLVDIRSSGTLRVLRTNSKKGKLRVVVCSREELPSIVIGNHSSVLIVLKDPDQEEGPFPKEHGLGKLLDSAVLEFKDVDPAEVQDSWEDHAGTVMLSDHGKKFWSLILRRWDPPLEVVVIQDQGDRRALSMAYALCDGLHLDRSVIYKAGQEDWRATREDKPPNRYICDMAKSSRNLVVR